MQQQSSPKFRPQPMSHLKKSFTSPFWPSKAGWRLRNSSRAIPNQTTIRKIEDGRRTDISLSLLLLAVNDVGAFSSLFDLEYVTLVAEFHRDEILIVTFCDLPRKVKRNLQMPRPSIFVDGHSPVRRG
jgi:hypothetical protein